MVAVVVLFFLCRYTVLSLCNDCSGSWRLEIQWFFISNGCLNLPNEIKTSMLCNGSDYSSSGGSSSSMYLSSTIRISVVSSPRSTSLMKCASICICTCIDISTSSLSPHLLPTISKAPLRTPHRMFENQSSSWDLPSSGSSTKSASGFSSNIRENCLLSGDQLATTGVMFKKILKPIWTRLVFRIFLHRNLAPCLWNSFSSLLEVCTSLGTRFGKVVFDQSHADVVAHLIELFIDLSIVAIVVTTQLSNDSAISQSHQFRIDLVYPSPRRSRSAAYKH